MCTDSNGDSQLAWVSKWLEAALDPSLLIKNEKEEPVKDEGRDRKEVDVFHP